MRRALLTALLAAPTAALAGTIVVDTGHSPRSTGSVASDGTPEFLINRGFTEVLVAELRKLGHKVIDTHALDRDRTLYDRVRPTVGADLLISVHHDPVQPFLVEEGLAEELSGYSLFVSTKNKKLHASLRCAVHAGEAMNRVGEAPSRHHAADVPGERRPLLDDRRGIYRHDDLDILKAASSAALQLEPGVVANPYEIGKLTDRSWQARVAVEVAAEITKCVQPATQAAKEPNR